MFYKNIFLSVSLFSFLISNQASSMQYLQKDHWNEEMAEQQNREFELGEQLNALAWPHVPQDLKEIEELLKAGANPNINIDKEWKESLLHKIALDDQWSPLVALLLRYNANHQKENVRGQTPLHGAAVQGAVNNVMLLLQANAKVDSRILLRDTPLHALAKYLTTVRPRDYKRHLQIAKMLINAGANVDCENNDGDTPINIISSSSKFNKECSYVYEFHEIFRKKIAKEFFEKIKSISQHRDSYFDLLSPELVELTAICVTEPQYRANQVKVRTLTSFLGNI